MHISDLRHGNFSNSTAQNLEATTQTLEALTALVIGNCSFWGAGLKVLPEADSSDGWLDAVALQGLGLWDFLTKGRSVLYRGMCHQLGLTYAQSVCPPYSDEGAMVHLLCEVDSIPRKCSDD